MHTATGRLRGRYEPRLDILDRLLEINPNFRVYWLPPGAPQNDERGNVYQRPAMWRVCEYRPCSNRLRQEAAAARFRRLTTVADKEKVVEKNPGMLYDCEQSMDECFAVGEFSDEFFGTEQMFQDLKHTEGDLAALRNNLLEAQASEAEGEITEEMGINPIFQDHVREIAKDFYNRVKGNPQVGYSKGWQ